MRLLLTSLSLCALALPGSAIAQERASHQVRVSVPVVLRLRLDGGAVPNQAGLPLDVHVDGATSVIDPASTRLEVFANVGWQLSVSFVAHEGGEGLVLGWRGAGRDGVLRGSPSVVARGTPTGGWQPIDVAYRVVNEPADGTYRGTIAYTLARP